MASEQLSISELDALQANGEITADIAKLNIPEVLLNEEGDSVLDGADRLTAEATIALLPVGDKFRLDALGIISFEDDVANRDEILQRANEGMTTWFNATEFGKQVLGIAGIEA